jgi:hypothetical protein
VGAKEYDDDLVVGMFVTEDAATDVGRKVTGLGALRVISMTGGIDDARAGWTAEPCVSCLMFGRTGGGSGRSGSRMKGYGILSGVRRRRRR